MKSQVFISYDASDRRYKNKILKWESQGKLGDVIITSLDDDDLWDDDENLLQDELVRKLQEAELVIVLVGDNNADHPWLDWEGEFCHQWGIRRFLMRIPYTTGAIPREFEVLEEIAYNPNAIEKEVRDQMTQKGPY